MFISTIIPTFNRADLLGTTIEAVLSQSRRPDEVLVVIDGSEDHTREVVGQYAGQVRVLDKENSGKADSLNQALATIEGSHIWIVDDDDVPRPGGLAALVETFERAPQSGLVFGRHERFSVDPETGKISTSDTGYWDDRGSDWFLVATLEDFFVHQPAMLVTRDLYEAAGPFDPEMRASEDYDMLIRLAMNGRVASTDTVIYDQRVHDGARGQKGHQYAARRRVDKWLEYDQSLFRRLDKTLSASAYLPSHLAMTPLLRRQALLQKGVVMLRKGLWELALTAFEQAAGTKPQEDLTSAERGVLRRALLGKYGCDMVLSDDAAMRAFKVFRTKGAFENEIVRALARSLVWLARTAAKDGRLSAASRYGRAYFEFAIRPPVSLSPA